MIIEGIEYLKQMNIFAQFKSISTKNSDYHFQITFWCISIKHNYFACDTINDIFIL